MCSYRHCVFTRPLLLALFILTACSDPISTPADADAGADADDDRADDAGADVDDLHHDDADTGDTDEVGDPADRCGDGTSLVGRSCVVEGHECGRDYVVREGFCRRLGERDVNVPFSEGVRFQIGGQVPEPSNPRDQRGLGVYGVVFIVDGATSVVAARGGRVRSVAEREQARSTKLEVSIDHGDGTIAVYQMDTSDHLFVSEGDPMCRGQQIGQLDTSSSQLWFDVRDIRGFSKPIVFPESDTFDQGGRQGSFTSFRSYTSQTDEVTECPRSSFSTCDENIFVHRGVVLDEESPCSVIPDGEELTISGTVLLDGFPSGSAIAYWNLTPTNPVWQLECAPVIEGRFTVTMAWSDAEGTGFVPWVWQIATEGCESYDWGETPWEPELRLLPPPIDDSADELPPPASPEEVACGLDTVLSDETRRCVVDESCGPHRAMLDGRCHRIEGIAAAFPFEEGTVTPILGAHHAYLSHRGQYTHAMDFDVPEGTVILAARAGVVVEVYEETVGNGGTANQVVIEHDDGTTGEYLHLQHQGALVETGEQVCTGQSIGFSGNTGWSDSPHLHLEIRDAFGYSQPLQFVEAEHHTGLLMAGREYESTTVATTECDR